MPLIGRSPAMQDIYRSLARLMQTDLTVMVTGERVPARTGRPRPARLRQAQKRAVRGHQHGGHPARSDRKRIVRPREGRFHRRQHAPSRPIRAGRRRHVFSRRDRRNADGGAKGCCACSSKANTRRSAGAPRSTPMCASSPRPTRICAIRSSRVVSRGFVLPSECRAAPTAAVARTNRRHCRSRAPFLRSGGRGRITAQTLGSGGARTAPPLSLARQYPRTENLARRLAALYPQETITEALIETELGLNAPLQSLGPSPSGRRVQRRRGLH